MRSRAQLRSRPIPIMRFDVFVANLRSGELSRDSVPIKLQEQPFRVLRMLLEQAGEVVTREELQEKLWQNDTFVDFDHGINVAIAKIRHALRDSAEEPKFVETVGRRGYRFIAPVFGAIAAGPAASKRDHVGRGKEHRELLSSFESAAAGHGVLLCVAGEAGIGKTTLVEDFLSELHAKERHLVLAKGRCSERLAGAEAYLPFLEALQSLLRSDSGEAAATLRSVAPSWYAQLFPLAATNPSDATLLEYIRTATQERVKRELSVFLQEVTRHDPLVLFFDDLHWADPSTIDLLAHLTTNFDHTRILAVVTYRPSELFLTKNPFIGVMRDLQARATCREIEVEFLSEADVERYISLQFPQNRFPTDFATLVHSRTEGNPLFMVDLLRYMRDREIIVRMEAGRSWQLAQSLLDTSRGFPQSVKSVIERKIEQFSDRDREVLTAAAVEGYNFDSAVLVRALQADSMEIEEGLERLDRVNGFVKRLAEDEYPDGTLTMRYRFVHVLYQDALYASLSPTRRTALSASVAGALEGLSGAKISAIAVQLAFLYESARDPNRASGYFLVAAMNAQRIFANQEAISLAQRGLALLEKTPETTERTQKELGLRITLAFSLLFTRGYGAPEVGHDMARARALSNQLGDTAQVFPILFGLWIYYITAPDLKASRRIAEQMVEIAHAADDPTLLMAHVSLGLALHHHGELVPAYEQLEKARQYHDPALHGRYLELYRMEAGLNGGSESVRILWMLGYPDQAYRRSEEILELARTIPNPASLAFSLLFKAFLHQSLSQPEKVLALSEECIALCNQHGVTQERDWILFLYGWALAEVGRVKEGVSQLKAALDAQLCGGGQIARPQFLAFLAEVYLHGGRATEGMIAVEEALTVAARNGDRYYDAELWRLKGEFFNAQGNSAEAESCFEKGVNVARHQAAKSLELRACTSLCRLWQKQGKRREAQQVLRATYSWFTEGFGTADLREAEILLEQLAYPSGGTGISCL